MPLPETPPEWKEALGTYLAKQFPGFEITVRDAAAVVGLSEPNHTQLNVVSDLLRALGWQPHQVRAPGGRRTRVYWKV